MSKIEINDGRFVSFNNLEIVNAMSQFRNIGENIQVTCPNNFVNKIQNSQASSSLQTARYAPTPSPVNPVMNCAHKQGRTQNITNFFKALMVTIYVTCLTTINLRSIHAVY